MVNWLPDKTLAVNTSGNTSFTNTGKAKTAGIEAVSLQSNQVILIITTVRFMLAMLGMENTSLTNNGGTIDLTGNAEVGKYGEY